MGRTITAPIRQITPKSRQLKGAREVQAKGPRGIDKSVDAVVEAVLTELTKHHEAGKAPRYASKKVFDKQFPLWTARLVDSKKHPDPKRRLRFAKKVLHELKRRKAFVLEPDTEGFILVYAASFIEQRDQEQRRLAMAAHSSTGNVATTRKGVAA